MKRTKIILFLIIGTLLLSGCSLSGEEIGAMLTPPAMGAGREELSQAINASIGEGYELVYPQSGSYRTGIISEDLTGDGETEAICFYRPSGKKGKLCFLAMKKQAEGWAKLAKGESEAESVGRVAFGDLDGNGLSEIVVGWQYLGETDGSFDVYSLESGKAESLYSGLYTRFVMLDAAPSKLAVISRNSATKAVTASLIGKHEGKVGLINSVAMYNRTDEFLGVEANVTLEGLPAVYVDSQSESGMCVTEVLALNEQGRLTNELLTQTNISTRRQTAVTCRDVNGDGVMEIPCEQPLPPYMRDGLLENLYLIRWCDFNGKTLSEVSASFVEITEKITVDFPSQWIGAVTVERGATADRSFVFKTHDGETLFTIRIFALAEYTENYGMEGWRKLYSDSDNVYGVYCEPDNSMNIDYMEIYSLFRVG